MSQPDYQQLVEELALMRRAIEKSGSIFRFLRLSQAMGLVGLWGGIGLLVFTGVWYQIDVRFGGIALAPPLARLLLLALGLALLVAIAVGKIVLILSQGQKTHRGLTLIRLVSEVYTPQTLPILVPCAAAGVGVAVFLLNRGLTQYMAPAMSIVLGLVFLVFLNVFYLKGMLYAGAWLIGAGLVVLFGAETIHPALAVATTFGLGFMGLYVGDRARDKV